MTLYRLSPAAQADLNEICDYSARNWGAEQADRYILRIKAACDDIAAGRRRGRPIDEIRPGYRKFAVQSHFLFYQAGDIGQITVIRILHQHMDVAARLNDRRDARHATGESCVGTQRIDNDRASACQSRMRT